MPSWVMDALVILSNIDGVYDGDPSLPESRVIRRVEPDARMDVDAGAAVGVLRHHPGDHGHLPQVQLVGNAVYEDGEQPRIGENDLLLVRRRRIAVEGGFNVRHQHLLYPRQLL